MYRALSSDWGVLGRNTRSAFRRTPSRAMQPICKFVRASCTFEHLPWLASQSAAHANSLVATFALCSPYASSLEIL